MSRRSVLLLATCALLTACTRAVEDSAVWNVSVDTIGIPMRDGVKLAAIQYRPDGEGRFPALVHRTPYSKERYARLYAFPQQAARRGYLVFLVDVRGRYGSEGEFEAYRNEGPDGFDTIEWIAALPYATGRVGTWGGSYPGYVQWLALAEDPPHLGAAAPDMTPVSSHHFFYQGGAFPLDWYEWFIPLILPDLRRRAGDRSGPWSGDSASTEWAPQRDQWYTYRPLADVPLLRQYAPYYYDWLTNPDSSVFWDFANVEDDFTRMRAPVFLLSGWYDDAYGPTGAARGFAGMQRAATPEARTGTRLVLGPWTHSALSVRSTRAGDLDFGPSAGIDYDRHLLDFFDRWLKGLRNGADRGAAVSYFVMGENRWRTAMTWPPGDATTLSLYLDSDGDARSSGGNGRLVERHGGGADLDEYLFDPRTPVRSPNWDRAGAVAQASVESRRDVLVYSTAPLEQALTIAGEIEVELYVSSDQRDTDFAVMLTDVHPSGASYNLASAQAGMLRMRYREGFGRQLMMEPDSVYRIVIGEIFTAVRFDVGHRIRLQITSSRAPMLDVNPNTGGEIASETRLVPARQTVYHDATRASRVVLPVIPTRP